MNSFGMLIGTTAHNVVGAPHTIWMYKPRHREHGRRIVLTDPKGEVKIDTKDCVSTGDAVSRFADELKALEAKEAARRVIAAPAGRVPELVA